MRPSLLGTGKIIRSSLLAALVIGTAASCSSKPPEIKTVIWLMVLHPAEPSGKIEKLSFFANCADEDGFEDVETLYLVNERQELFWKFTKDNWARRDQGGDVWIGSNGITDPETKSFPRGTYRLICIDRGGERTERDVSVSPPDTSGIELPTASVAGDSITAKTILPNCVILFYDKSGNPTKAAMMGSDRAYSLNSLFGSANYREASTGFALFAWDDANRIGAYSRTYRY
jgi:hypothetical protein